MNEAELRELYKAKIVEYFGINRVRTREFVNHISKFKELMYKVNKKPLTAGEQEKLDSIIPATWVFISEVWDYVNMFTTEFDLLALQQEFAKAMFENFGINVFKEKS